MTRTTRQDVDIGDDRPIPSHKEGADAYDVFLDKLKHPRAAEVVKSLQQFVAAFKARAGAPSAPLPSPGPRWGFQVGVIWVLTSRRAGGEGWGRGG